MKKNIVIVGYPKSGTTWLCRLVAELISCPLQGDWGFDDISALYKEGMSRESEYRVFKSHHKHKEIIQASSLTIYKTIYIIRDPRDVVISGAYYFRFLPKFLANKNGLKLSPFFKKGLNKLVSKKEKRRQMINAVLFGESKLNPWLNLSWQDHFLPYKNDSILFIKYEDLIDNPEKECEKLLSYIGVFSNKKHLKYSIEKQSFQNTKINDLKNDNKQLKKLLRKGVYGNWKKEFTSNESSMFKENLSKVSDFYSF